MKRIFVCLLLSVALPLQGRLHATLAPSSQEYEASDAVTASEVGQALMDSRDPAEPFGNDNLVKKGIGLGVVLLLMAYVGLWIRDMEGDLAYQFDHHLPYWLRGCTPNYLPCHLTPLLGLPFWWLYEGLVWAMEDVYGLWWGEAVEGSPSWLGSFAPEWVQGVVMCAFCWLMGYCVQDERGDFPYYFTNDVVSVFGGSTPKTCSWHVALVLGMAFFLLCEGVDRAVEHVYAKVLAEEKEGSAATRQRLVRAGWCLAVMGLLSLGLGYGVQDAHGDLPHAFRHAFPALLRGQAHYLRWYLAPLLALPLCVLYQGVGWGIAYVYPRVVDGGEGQDEQGADSRAFQRTCIQKGLFGVVMVVFSVGVGCYVQNAHGDFPYTFGSLPKRLQGHAATRLPWYLAPLFFMPFFLLCEAVDVLVGYACAKVGRGARDPEDNEGMDATKRLPV